MFSKKLLSSAALAALSVGLRIAGGAAISAGALGAMTSPAVAQVTTSGVRGSVTDANGAAVGGATITVTDTRTGASRSTTSAASGQFDLRNLEVGGPYTVTAEAAGQQTTRIDNVVLALGRVTDVNVTFSGEDSGDVIVVTASRENVAQVAIGPSAAFNLQTLENSPAGNRDIKDIIRMDPRVYMDEAFVNAISCAGANPRFNSLTVDGVRLNDNFGLNSNGYPTERIPFSYDAIRQVAVELAPFDVMYGSFTSCNINAVTKSGGNEFHGGLFYDFTSDGLTGDRTDGIDRNLGTFDEKRYGFNIGGPIIPDRLFFFAAYEKFEGANIFGQTPADVGLTDAAYQAVIDTAVNQYGYIAGGLPTSIPVEDEKIFARIDWHISDRHRAVFTYNFNDGFNFSGSDTGSTQIPDGNHYYERGAELNDYTATLYSDWTDNFSTELRASHLTLDNRQDPVFNGNFGEIQVRVPSANGTTTIYLGPDDSRHSNKLNYELWNYKVAGTLNLGDHVLTAGFEREEFEVFNLFVQQSKGEWRFNSPAEFASGDFFFFNYTNAAGTNDVNDGAAEFGYQVNTLYAQDEWRVTDRLDVVAGLRYDWYTSDDRPTANATFVANYGFSNEANMDGRGVLQPRIGFTYDMTDNIQLHGGVGLFSGGNPNVWISNNYSNNGVALADLICQTPATVGGAARCPILPAPQNVAPNLADFTYGGDGRPFYNVPQEAIDFVTNANGAGNVNALDPDFEIPSEWKFSIGAVWDLDTNISWLGDNWRIYADFLYSRTNEAATVVPLGYVQTGTAPDGRPIYGGNTNDFLLTNTLDKGHAAVWSIAVQKSYDNGIDWSFGYAYTDAQDVNPMTSSVAFSNFSNIATSDPLDPGVSTSDYEIAHRFTLQFNWEHEFIDSHPTRLSLFATANEGAPYSYTFNNTNIFESAFRSSRQLAYIPTGVDDPLIAPTSNAAAVQALVNFVNNNDRLSDYRGRIADRNVAADDWWSKIDLRFSQEFPGLRTSDSVEGFVVINNLTNLLNDEWGIVREHSFPGTAALYTATIVNNQYNITAFNAGADNDAIVVNPSLWQVHVGVKYKF